MDRATVALDDGSWLLVEGLLDLQEEEADASARTEVLGAVHDFFVNAVIGGVAANLTFQMLKSLARQLRAQGHTRQGRPCSAQDVASAVTDFLGVAGYATVVVGEVVHYSNQGWLVRGTADGADFQARAEPHGQLIHVQVAL